MDCFSSWCQKYFFFKFEMFLGTIGTCPNITTQAYSKWKSTPCFNPLSLPQPFPGPRTHDPQGLEVAPRVRQVVLWKRTRGGTGKNSASDGDSFQLPQLFLPLSDFVNLLSYDLLRQDGRRGFGGCWSGWLFRYFWLPLSQVGSHEDLARIFPIGRKVTEFISPKAKVIKKCDNVVWGF